MMKYEYLHQILGLVVAIAWEEQVFSNGDDAGKLVMIKITPMVL